MQSLVHDRRRLRRVLALVVLLFAAPVLAGCLRVQASITVSSEDRVSGEIIAAVKPRDDKDAGPQFTDDLDFNRKISIGRYNEDGYVGSTARFSDLSFAEVPQLANLSRDATGVDISLRRAGNLVLLEGRVDLTNVTNPDADVKFSAEFPGEITTTNGERIGSNAVEWKLKPAAVTTMSAQARYSDPSTRSFAATAIWLGLAALLTAGIITALAWRDHDRTTPRFAAADQPDDL